MEKKHLGIGNGMGETFGYDSIWRITIDTRPKSDMDTRNDGLQKVTPLKNDNFWYLC